jgi:hypothetical protein
MEEEEVESKAEDYVRNDIFITKEEFVNNHRYKRAGIEVERDPSDDPTCVNLPRVSRLTLFERIQGDMGCHHPLSMSYRFQGRGG